MLMKIKKTEYEVKGTFHNSFDHFCLSEGDIVVQLEEQLILACWVSKVLTHRGVGWVDKCLNHADAHKISRLLGVGIFKPRGSILLRRWNPCHSYKCNEQQNATNFNESWNIRNLSKQH